MVKDLLASGDIVGAAQREADACDKDGYDVTAELLRRLATAVEEGKPKESAHITVLLPPDVKPHSIDVIPIRPLEPITPEAIERGRNLHGELLYQIGTEFAKRGGG